MTASEQIRSHRIGFIGAGNLAQSILRAFLDSGFVDREQIVISNRNERKLERVSRDFQIRAAKTNEEVIDFSDIVIIGVKPQDFYQCIEPIAHAFNSDQIIISLAAGISLQSVQKLIPNSQKILRVMPTTAAKIKESVIAYAATAAVKPHLQWINELLSTMGIVVPVEDGEMMRSILVGASSGIGFVYELMIYWQEWLEEHDIDAKTARNVTIQTFRAAAAMACHESETPLSELQRKVVSLKGVTAAGLDSMRELEIERALRISFEKAAMRDQELGSTFVPV